MRPGDRAPTVFTTVGLRDACRVELWEEHNATALIGLEVRAPEPLQATELNVQLPKVHLARVVGSAHVVERTARIIGRSPAEAVAVYVSLRGDSWFQHLGGTRSLRAGTAVVCETDRPFARGFDRGLEELVVKLPRQAIGARAGQLTLPSPLTYGQDDPYVRALAHIVGGATRTGRAVAADESAVLDIVAVLAAGRNVACAVAHRAAARAFIEQHLTDPGLGAEQVAAAIGISERQLSRVFAADGISVPRHILERRLQLARALLSSTAHAERASTVAEIAGRCGFTSATYFSHAFRRCFAQRAGDLRRQAST
ncbi:MAG: AraC family transcriptional regulator [Streptosporangiaceae bacterium]